VEDVLLRHVRCHALEPPPARHLQLKGAKRGCHIIWVVLLPIDGIWVGTRPTDTCRPNPNDPSVAPNRSNAAPQAVQLRLGSSGGDPSRTSSPQNPKHTPKARTCPSRRRRPEILPMVLRSAKMSRRHVLPDPLGPMTASICPVSRWPSMPCSTWWCDGCGWLWVGGKWGWWCIERD
jgi:hypothetical protein